MKELRPSIQRAYNKILFAKALAKIYERLANNFFEPTPLWKRLKGTYHD